MLKRLSSVLLFSVVLPAAFGRLCVETHKIDSGGYTASPAAFGRLCVETIWMSQLFLLSKKPAAFGRLCVETPSAHAKATACSPAAFGRLCVETRIYTSNN